MFFFFFELETTKTWKNISLFVAIPCCIAIGAKALFFDHEEPHHGERVKYGHMHIRSKALYIYIYAFFFPK